MIFNPVISSGGGHTITNNMTDGTEFPRLALPGDTVSGYGPLSMYQPSIKGESGTSIQYQTGTFSSGEMIYRFTMPNENVVINQQA